MQSRILFIAFLFLPALSCFPGGAGTLSNITIIPSATRMFRPAYDILCVDKSKRKEWEKALANGESIEPPVNFIPQEKYSGGCEEEGHHSTFFLFNLFPVTAPLNPEYAIAAVVQRLEGDSMINILAWNEIHYYSVLGRVSVYKIRGDVIRYSGAGRNKK